MAKDHDSYYSPEVEQHFRRRSGIGTYTAGAVVIAGLVGLGIGWLIYDRMSAQAEQERRRQARLENKANARRALEMKKRGPQHRHPDSKSANEGMRNIPAST
ncbi:hypothetical protein [Microvirga brassicacearum]|uniref:Uncharacterized protein n=1 Tax=Microvirga brassicacearum TaxID=2580413 RepID=A0A5N3P647_9HYPH|nr:hypothetical protein [Microvirga brassicacearum]KAB0265192.1 hypothetical protein FEZ63_19785 [Microvirga brassicacearum]